MGTERFRKKLLREESQLVCILNRLERVAYAISEEQVREFADQATADGYISQALEETTVLSRSLMEVQDALRRIGLGTFGKCTLCGRQIQRARLEAVPWTPYCHQDQHIAEALESYEARYAG